MTPIQELGAVLKQTAENYWTERQSPLLLSNVHFHVAPILPNYREALEGRPLKEFILQTAAEFKYQLVEHPTQKAKVAVVPEGVEYQFPLTPSTASQSPREKDQSANIVMAFFERVAKLAPEDIDRINIPTSVLVKLLK